MISAITIKLLLVLLAVAFLGFLIGLSSMRLHQARSQNKALLAKQNAMDKLTLERKELATENANIKQALESEQKLAGIMREKQSQLAAQQETLQVHSGLQEQRIEKITAELNTSEEKCIRLQRDFASFKANKLREVRMLKVSADEWLDNEELPVLNKRVEHSSSQSGNDRSANRPNAIRDGGRTGASANQSNSGKANERSFVAHNSVKSRSVAHASGAQQSDGSTGLEEMTADVYEPGPDETQPIIASELDIPSLAESELPDSVEELEFELVEPVEPN